MTQFRERFIYSVPCNSNS